MERHLYISREAFRGLVEGLLGEREVWGTTLRNGVPVFDRIGSFEELRLSKGQTPISAKRVFFPPREELLRFDRTTGECEPVIDAPETAVIGLHACDIHALKLLDRVFSHGTPDANYMERRRRSIVIGVDCLPERHCFCASVETSEAGDGFDLFLNEVEGGYVAAVGSEAGGGALERHCAVETASTGQLDEVRRGRERKAALFETRLEAEPSALPLIYAGAYHNPVWERIGSRCYGCGSCNHVCPTCYCFDVKDEVSLDLSGGVRYREWDGCTHADFAKVAGGHDFRKTRAQRLRHRFLRKFQYQRDRFGALMCVGCGRCSRACLVEIDIAEVTNGIIKESPVR
ncbi:MAG TPA: hypothetical protein ENJ37_07475 [Deltaproteobacteria bacterium]|nr:hypothetical protein [Deltaproteobacteria bacterium]